MIGTGIGLGVSGFVIGQGLRPAFDWHPSVTKSTVPGIGPTPTYSRASEGTYRDASGTVQTAAIDVMRFDHVYNGSSWVSKGWLCEEQRTNLLLNSATLSTQSVTTAATPYTLSFYGTGTVTLSGTSTAGPLVGTDANNRVSLTFTPSAGTLTLTVSGSVTNANLEAGLLATSWIPTTGASATRSADVCQITGSDFSSMWNASAGTIIAEFEFWARNTGIGNGCMIFQADDGTLNNRILGIGSETFSGPLYKDGVFIGSGGAAQANFYMGDPGVNAVNKCGWAWAANDFYGYSGAIAGSDASGSIPTVTQLKIGNRLGDFFLTGYVSRFRYYRERLANSAIQGLVA